MMTIGDIVALAKAGYKPADVKELIEMTKEEEKDIETTADSSKSAMDKPSSSEPAAEVSPSASAAPDDEEDDTDYKALYEQAKKDLATAQKENVNKDISSAEDNQSDADIIKDLIKEFM